MQTLTYCDDKVMSTRTTAGQFKGQFKGAMDEMSQKVQKASTLFLLRSGTHLS
jgi:flagellar hook-basal body complex protein FliE